MKVKKLTFDRNNFVMPVIIMLALAAAGVVAVLLVSRAERITVKEPLYQYVFEHADEYPDGISMKKTREDLIVDNGYQQYSTNGYPFFYQNKEALILTDNFLYMGRDASYHGRVDYYTVVEKTDGGYSLSEPDGTLLTGGMLHNGGDVFIFLEDTEITYNQKTIKLTGLSYVVCYHGQSILICSYGQENAVYEELGTEGASALMENGVRIDFVNDIYYKPNGTKHLLYTSPEVFDTIDLKEEEDHED